MTWANSIYLFFKHSGLPVKVVDDIKLQIGGDYQRFGEARQLALRLSPNRTEHDQAVFHTQSYYENEELYGDDYDYDGWYDYYTRTMRRPGTTTWTSPTATGGMTMEINGKNGTAGTNIGQRMQETRSQQRRPQRLQLINLDNKIQQLKSLRSSMATRAKAATSMMAASLVAANGTELPTVR